MLLNATKSLLIDIFWLLFRDCYSADACLGCMISPRHVAIDTIYQRFHNKCLT